MNGAASRAGCQPPLQSCSFGAHPPVGALRMRIALEYQKVQSQFRASCCYQAAPVGRLPAQPCKKMYSITMPQVRLKQHDRWARRKQSAMLRMTAFRVLDAHQNSCSWVFWRLEWADVPAGCLGGQGHSPAPHCPCKCSAAGDDAMAQHHAHRQAADVMHASNDSSKLTLGNQEQAACVCPCAHRSLLAGWSAGTCKLHATQSFQVATPGRCYSLLAHGRLRGACA